MDVARREEAQDAAIRIELLNAREVGMHDRHRRAQDVLERLVARIITDQ